MVASSRRCSRCRRSTGSSSPVAGDEVLGVGGPALHEHLAGHDAPDGPDRQRRARVGGLQREPRDGLVGRDEQQGPRADLPGAGRGGSSTPGGTLTARLSRTRRAASATAAAHDPVAPGWSASTWRTPRRELPPTAAAASASSSSTPCRSLSARVSSTSGAVSVSSAYQSVAA